MITKVSYCFAPDNENGLGKIQVLLCSNTAVCGYVNLKNNSEEFQRNEFLFPFGILVHLNKMT